MLRWSVQGVWSQAVLYRRCVVELVCTGGVVLGWSVQGVWSWAGLYRGCGLGLVCTWGGVHLYYDQCDMHSKHYY